MAKILWLSDSPFTNTGYATISRNILNGLADEHECHYIAHNYVGQHLPPGLMMDDGLELKFHIHGAGREGYCSDIIEAKIREIGADIFIVLLDTFMAFQTGYHQKNFAPAKSIFYFPSDGGGGLPQGCLTVLQNFKNAVAMAKFGRDQVKDRYGFDAHYIPHAVDTKLFKPVDEERKREIKKQMNVASIGGTIAKGWLQDKYVVGCVARNQGRKMLDRTMKAFKIFADKRKDAVLYFHCDPYDSAAIFDMRETAQRLGLANKICWSPIRYFENYAYNDMPLVYQAMDLFFLTTSGEGFGVPTIEAMSCGIPAILTDYTTTYELVEEDGVAGIGVNMVDCEKTTKELLAEGKSHAEIDDYFMEKSTLTGSWAVERGLCSIPKAAEALEKLYTDKVFYESCRSVGRMKVKRSYDWPGIINQWKTYLNEVMK